MCIIKLAIFTSLLVYAYTAKCPKRKRIILQYKRNPFDFSINGMTDENVRNALHGGKGAYSGDKVAWVVIKGGKRFRNFNYKKICFQVKGAVEMNVVYEGMITDPKCDKNGCYAVGAPLSRELPKMLSEPGSFKRVCLKNRGTKSKISISLLPEPGQQLLIRKMLMKACIFD